MLTFIVRIMSIVYSCIVRIMSIAAQSGICLAAQSGICLIVYSCIVRNMSIAAQSGLGIQLHSRDQVYRCIVRIMSIAAQSGLCLQLHSPDYVYSCIVRIKSIAAQSGLRHMGRDGYPRIIYCTQCLQIRADCYTEISFKLPACLVWRWCSTVQYSVSVSTLVSVYCGWESVECGGDCPILNLFNKRVKVEIRRRKDDKSAKLKARMPRISCQENPRNLKQILESQSETNSHRICKIKQVRKWRRGDQRRKGRQVGGGLGTGQV